jgi:uncharacterized protein
VVADVRVLDGAVLRRWADVALAGLLDAQGEIDRLNVYPVPDSDTGTNLVRTVQAGVDALQLEPGPGLAELSEVFAMAALRGAAGNSGTILSQILRGLADAALDVPSLDGPALAAALTRSAALARGALPRPVEGTILSVADAAADAATRSLSTRSAGSAGSPGSDSSADLAVVVRAARRGAATALAATPGQLAALGGRVDAGGRGLLVLFEALDAVVSGEVGWSDPPAEAPTEPPTPTLDQDAHGSAGQIPNGRPSGTASDSPSHEVMYLLATEREGEAVGVADLRTALDQLGDSVVVVGGNGLWQVHAHVDDVGAALEAGLAAGRPHQVRITQLAAGREPAALTASAAETTPAAVTTAPTPATVPAVLALVGGAGLAAIVATTGVHQLDPTSTQALDRAILDLVDGLGGSPVVVLPDSLAALTAADAAARAGDRLTVIRSHSAVQVLAALAVHDGRRDPARDLLEMSTAAAGCRDGLVEVAAGDGLTSAGWCHAGDVLGHVGGDVAIVGRDLAEVAGQVVDLLLGGGGELVTLVAGEAADPGLVVQVAAGVRSRRPDVDVTTYDGGQPGSHLLVGVE